MNDIVVTGATKPWWPMQGVIKSSWWSWSWSRGVDSISIWGNEEAFVRVLAVQWDEHNSSELYMNSYQARIINEIKT